MNAEQEKPRKLVKTLTLGAGTLHEFDKRKGEIAELSDDRRARAYVALRAASAAFAQLTNIVTARMYAQIVLGVPKDQAEAFATSYKPIQNRVADAIMLSGSIKSQTYRAAKAHFSGDHAKELLGKGATQLPTHRTDGTHPILQRATESLLTKLDDRYFLCIQVFDEKWAKENELPNWLAFPLVIKKQTARWPNNWRG